MGQMGYGLSVIVLLQLLSPMAVFVYAINAVDWSSFAWDPARVWCGDTCVHGNLADYFVFYMKLILSILFISCFAANGALVLADDRSVWMKLYLLPHMFKELDRKAEADNIAGGGDPLPENKRFALRNKMPKLRWVHLGPLINCYIVFFCSLSIPMLFWLCETPVDVVFDALALLFLFNLDDVAESDLGFLGDDDWDAGDVGKAFHVAIEKVTTAFQGTFNGKTDDDVMDEIWGKWSQIWGTDKEPKGRKEFYIYKYFGTALHIAAVVLPLLFCLCIADAKGGEPAAMKSEIDELRFEQGQEMSELRSQVANLTRIVMGLQSIP